MYEIKPQHDFLVGIDSDGCAFDTMELKHKECFIPNIIKFYQLQGDQQVRTGGGRIRQSLFEESRCQPIPRTRRNT